MTYISYYWKESQKTEKKKVAKRRVQTLISNERGIDQKRSDLGEKTVEMHTWTHDRLQTFNKTRYTPCSGALKQGETLRLARAKPLPVEISRIEDDVDTTGTQHTARPLLHEETITVNGPCTGGEDKTGTYTRRSEQGGGPIGTIRWTDGSPDEQIDLHKHQVVRASFIITHIKIACTSFSPVNKCR